MRRGIKSGDYAKRLAAAMRSTFDPATNEPYTKRGLERRARELGRPISYEQFRKVLAGASLVSEEFNDMVCRILPLDRELMWQIAQAEMALRRFGPETVKLAAPVDDRVKENWKLLTADEQARVARMIEGIVAERQLQESA